VTINTSGPIIRLRPAPHLISLGGGVSYGSGQFFGQTADNLTNTLNDLQRAEAMHKLAQGDPETFIAYWDAHKDSTTGLLKTQMETYYAQAQKSIKTTKADAAALAEYSRTDNHQKYMDYLITRLDGETDPTVISKLDSQINTLRGRVFAAGSGSAGVGGGYTSADVTAAQKEHDDAKTDANASLAANTPLTDSQLARLQTSGDVLNTIVKAVATANPTLHNSSMLASGEAAAGDAGKYQAKSEAVSLGAIGDRKFALDSKGQSQFEDSIVGKPISVQIAAWTARVRDMNTTVGTLHSSSSITTVNGLLQVGESKLQDAINASATPTNKGASEDVVAASDAFGTYQSWALGAKNAKQITYVAPSADFRNIILHSTGWVAAAHSLGLVDVDVTDPAAVKAALLAMNFPIDAVLGDKVKAAFSGYQSATWDPTTGTFTGDPEAVKSAQEAVAGIRALSTVPSSPYYGVQGTDGEMYAVAHGDVSPNAIQTAHGRQGSLTGNMGAGAAQSNIIPPSGTSDQAQGQDPEQATSQTQSPDAQDRNAANGTASPSGLGGKPQPDLLDITQLTPDNINDHMDSSMAAAQNFLTYSSSNIADLPDWQPTQDQKDSTPDWNSMFPFSDPTTPLPETATPQTQAPDAQQMNADTNASSGVASQ
jgi:hypothetical protein